MPKTVILGAARTPFGKMGGSLSSLDATDLGGTAIAAALERAEVKPDQVQHVVFGQVLQAGQGQIPSRQAQIKGGIPKEVSSETVNKVCASGLRSAGIIDQAVRAGDLDIAVAGGMESMSNAPYLLERVREGLRLGNGEVVDSMIRDGLWCAFEQCHMGNAGEVVAERYHVGRAAQDDYAARSHQKAARATDAGAFKDEILPVSAPQRKGPPVVIDRDEPIRADTTVEALAKLEPAFKEGGTVTAGNAPGVNDGASAVVVMAGERAKALKLAPLARIVAQATSGLAPKLVLMTPVDAVRRVAEKAGWALDSVDLFELNEAFSVQAVAVVKELGLDPDRVNVHGGAVALGHAIGSSGTRVLTTLLYALAQRGLTRGIATLCLGGGNGVALAVERI
jgi:acetyl-CoA C-acetyltransferase